jgi:hypothetical protein
VRTSGLTDLDSAGISDSGVPTNFVVGAVLLISPPTGGKPMQMFASTAAAPQQWRVHGISRIPRRRPSDGQRRVQLPR